jgi:GT2 family glycosyltransferase
MELSVIIINYNTKLMTKECVDSYIDNLDKKVTYEIIIVDNNSKDGSKEYFNVCYSSIPNVNLICNDKNVGFGNANNIGVRCAKGKYLLFANSDTIIKKFNIHNMINCFEAKGDVGALSCKIINQDDSIQSLGFDYPSLLNDFKLNFLFWNYNFIKKYRYANYKDKGLIKRDWVSGSFLMCQKENFDIVEGFDPKIFMYAEDLDICARFQKIGKDNYVYDKEEIYHFHGKSGKIDYFKLIAAKKNYLYVIEKNGLSIFPKLIYTMNVIHISLLWFYKKFNNIMK